jgi:hypothetical protein
VRTPVDAFVLAKLEEKGLKPSPDTDRATYIRRATLDTWGLIPTPEQVREFVNDKSPNAYEKLADRLLSSPHYGERQARRWLDLARYADSAGFQNDNTRPNNFRYRDYVINGFNSPTSRSTASSRSSWPATSCIRTARKPRSPPASWPAIRTTPTRATWCSANTRSPPT